MWPLRVVPCFVCRRWPQLAFSSLISYTSLSSLSLSLSLPTPTPLKRYILQLCLSGAGIYTFLVQGLSMDNYNLWKNLCLKSVRRGNGGYPSASATMRDSVYSASKDGESNRLTASPNSGDSGGHYNPPTPNSGEGEYGWGDGYQGGEHGGEQETQERSNSTSELTRTRSNDA